MIFVSNNPGFYCDHYQEFHEHWHMRLIFLKVHSGSFGPDAKFESNWVIDEWDMFVVIKFPSLLGVYFSDKMKFYMVNDQFSFKIHPI